MPAQATFVDFKISLRKGERNSYSVDMQCAQPGDDTDVDPTSGELAPVQFEEKTLIQQNIDLGAYGQTLGKCLFADAEALSAFKQARANASGMKATLRLRLFIHANAPELQSLRWETMRLPGEDIALAADENVLFSRYLSSRSWKFVEKPGGDDLRALVVVANPKDHKRYHLAEVQVEKELAIVSEGLGKNIERTELAQPGETTLENIITHMRDGYDILYVVAHGLLVDDEPWLFFVKEDGKSDRVSGKELLERLGALEKLPRLVVLVSCQSAGTGATLDDGALSALGPRLAEIGVPAVIAMQGNVSMETMAQFMPVCLQELRKDGRIDRAMAAARGSVQRRHDWWMPVLFMRLKSGLLLDIDGTTPQDLAIPFMAQAPPEDFVHRPEEYERLIELLLSENNQTVAITATLQGAGGFGKTTLAEAICHDERSRDAFPDGILWVTLGDDGSGVMPGLRRLFRELTGREAQFVDKQDLVAQVEKRLTGLKCLMVIDDVWNEAHLEPFLQGGEQCARLVTTRLSSVVPRATVVVPIDAMKLNEAVDLLGSGIKVENELALLELARRLGEWPLLLKLVNRRLYEDVEKNNLPIQDAIDSVNEELDEFGLTSFDIADTEERSQAVSACIGISLKRLQAEARYGRVQVDEVTRFQELAIFPEDTPIPISTLTLLWKQTGSLSKGSTKKLCRRLADLSLILRYDVPAQTILLHDVTRHYLVDTTSSEKYRDWQNALLDGCASLCDNVWWHLPDDKYVYHHLLWHMREAGQQDKVDLLLFTYPWLEAKLQATDIVSLIDDFDLRTDAARHSQTGLLQHALQMSVGVLSRDKAQLPSQLHGRVCLSMTVTNAHDDS